MAVRTAVGRTEDDDFYTVKTKYEKPTLINHTQLVPIHVHVCNNAIVTVKVNNQLRLTRSASEAAGYPPPAATGAPPASKEEPKSRPSEA